MLTTQEKPVLSICIPTYTRSECLSECLLSFVSQIGENTQKLNEVEIIVSDNASTDNTEQIMSEFTKKYPYIHYFRNSENIGFDRNLAQSIEKSSGKYCLTIGDDDAIFENSLMRLLEELRTTNVPFYGLNSQGFDHNLNKAILSHPNLNIKKDIFYNSLYDFVITIEKYSDLVGIFAGMSTQLFLREKWISYSGKSKFYGTQCAHLFILLKVFKNSSYKQIANPIIKTRSSNVRWNTMTGLETSKKRAEETMRTIFWIQNEYGLPDQKNKIYIYITIREAWFTFKEIIKILLVKANLGGIISFYRKLR